MKDNIKTPKTNSQCDDFETQWKRWQQREGQAEEPVPDDQTFMHWVEVAQQTTAGAEKEVVRFPLRSSGQRVPRSPGGDCGKPNHSFPLQQWLFGTRYHDFGRQSH